MDNQNEPIAPAPAPMSAGNNRVVMGVLAYLGILVIIPFLMSRNDPFVRFHIKQGVVLAVIEIILWVISGMFWGLVTIIWIIQLITFVLSIVGIVNVVQNKEKELPLVGSLSQYVTI